MHDLTYLGNGEYQCQDCGLTVERAGVTEFQETDCEGVKDIAALNKKMAALDKKLQDRDKELAKIAERVVILENAAVAAPVGD